LLARDTDLVFGTAAVVASNIDVDATTRYQTMVGFGAAITDASAWVMQYDMSSALLADLFGASPGIGLSFTRLSIGASDFSLSQYTL
jgi:glucosylceramidase